ncbi:peptidase C13 family-domain-containing protein [Suillus clintonianus]|uniref:peptidase C13 family-domain-containing protein n=1 Tax=Suillus clintonianus TaxID=1904413 RepID=UPI001B8607BA|nr:peptidase C13 family-domain-containing protein [Suillus clintonianus]KAG2143072.1 peptidase C13 family-domain-containing protein [Suillus clintonianus]
MRLQLLPKACLLLLACFMTCAVGTFGSSVSADERAADFFGRHDSGSEHTNNWAVLVCASRYWFNYRHMANALGMYRTVKRLGIPDSNIILMLADDVACNARNKFAGSVYAEAGRHLDLYGENIEVDYRGYEVTVENFIRLLTGRVDPSMPRSKRLLTDDRSNIFVYMTGHGGNEFLKFQDQEEISAFDIADAFEQMWQKKRYNEILFMIDTCQANTMYSQFYSPNILATGSSQIEENSYSYENDNDIGVSVIDSYTHYVLKFMEGINKTSQTSMQDLFNSYDPVKIYSHPGIRSDLFRRPLDKTLITDFFGGVAQAEVFPLQEVVGSSNHHEKDPALPPTSREPDALSVPVVLSTTVTSLPTLAGETNVWDSGWKGVRKWTSVFIVGCLVSWVSFVR